MDLGVVVLRHRRLADVTSLDLAGYLRVIRLTHSITRLRAIAAEIEARSPDDEATLPLLKMIGLKVVRIERSN